MDEVLERITKLIVVDNSFIANKNKTYIYGLFDENNLRYIGKSCNPKRRMYNHLLRARQNTAITHVYCWIRSLSAADKKPIMKIIEEVDKDKWQEAEIRWIEYYKDQGIKLVNHRKGGCGEAVYDTDLKNRKSIIAKKWWDNLSKEDRENFVKNRKSASMKQYADKLSRIRQGYKRPNSSSKYLGVSKAKKKWVAVFANTRLGSFINEIDAAKAYNTFVLEKFGESAKINIIEE